MAWSQHQPSDMTATLGDSGTALLTVLFLSPAPVTPSTHQGCSVSSPCHAPHTHDQTPPARTVSQHGMDNNSRDKRSTYTNAVAHFIHYNTNVLHHGSIINDGRLSPPSHFWTGKASSDAACVLLLADILLRLLQGDSQHLSELVHALPFPRAVIIQWIHCPRWDGCLRT